MIGQSSIHKEQYDLYKLSTFFHLHRQTIRKHCLFQLFVKHLILLHQRRLALFQQLVQNLLILEDYSKAVAVEKKKLHGIKDKKYGMRFRLDGLFIRDNVMYYRIKMKNQSNINYDIDQLRFFIRDRKKAKRTATQEIEIKPLCVQNDTPTIKGQSEHIFVFALPKFTIPDQKYLAVQFMEKNGGRHLELNVKDRKITKAVPIESGLMSLWNEKSE